MSAPDIHKIEQRIDALAATPAGKELPEDARTVIARLLDALEAWEAGSAQR